MPEAKTSKAQQKATQKYIKNNYDRVVLTMPKGEREIYKDHAKRRGESLNAFINRAIQNQIKRDEENR